MFNSFNNSDILEVTGFVTLHLQEQFGKINEHEISLICSCLGFVWVLLWIYWKIKHGDVENEAQTGPGWSPGKGCFMFIYLAKSFFHIKCDMNLKSKHNKFNLTELNNFFILSPSCGNMNAVWSFCHINNWNKSRR